MRRAELPILNPCSEDYGAMRGPAQRRFCDRCEKHVHDLSAMTQSQAQALLRGRDGEEICVRYRCAPDGRIRFRPPSRAAAFVVVSLAMAACTGYAEPDSLESPEAAMVCRDASGYAVDCELLDEGFIPDAKPRTPVEPDSAEPVRDFTEVAKANPEPLQPAEDEDGEQDVEPCPLPPRGAGESIIQGGIQVSRREMRRQRRRQRRAERRRRKHAADDYELMGVLIE